MYTESLPYISDCVECQRLWRAYSSVTTEHIRLESKLQIAAIAHEDVVIVELTPQVEKAAAKRSAVRHAIKAHELLAHPSAAATSA